MLMGQRLQKAGLSFLSCKARHTAAGPRIEEIICETDEDVTRIKAWAIREGLSLVTARVATPSELQVFKDREESF